ncbi:hypothetical protein [Paenibacillus contaminans]|uniref:Uncharacterized protein n=1 Tax=Paenibacillus contaminans TaxID=450362 RepID=A0A329LZ57_9BACL|nr:hypothetical protein [Paenibacillus contaminans]RAV13295.1 hypothetical protein DQG23_33345 [Paenibacillus contaminans]
MKSLSAKVFVMGIGLLLVLSSVAGAFAWGPNTSLPTNTNTYWPAPALAKPGYLQTVTDPTFGSRITRVSGDPGTSIANVPGGVWGTTARHNYPKDAAWNADQTKLLLKYNFNGPGPGDPSERMVFLDGSTYVPLFSRLHWANELRWHPTDPNLMVYVSGNELGYWNPVTDAKTVKKTFADVTDGHFGPWEGNLSDDGRFVVIQSGNFAFAYDIANDVRYPNISTTADGMTLDFATISPLGSYVVVTGTVAGNPNYTKIYTKDGTLVQTWSELWTPSHYDLTVDADGAEVAVGSSRGAPYDGIVLKRRLTDGAATALTTGGYAGHTSARNVNRNGWVFVTYPYRDAGWEPYKNELVAVKLDGTRVERIAHLHANNREANGYWAQAQGSVSPDGLRVIYASNWDGDTNPTQAFVVDFRDKELSSVWSDGFDNNDYSTGGWLNNGTTLGTPYVYTGYYGAKFTGTNSLTKSVSTVGKGNITISYALKTLNSPTPNDHFICEWWNGTNWVVADHQTGYFGWAVKTLTLPAAANNLPYFQVRFRTNMNTAYAYLDKVEITGSPLVTIWSDGFDNNDFTTGGWSNNGTTLGTPYVYSGYYGAKLTGTNSLTKAVSTTGRSNIVVSYALKTLNSPAASDHFICEWWNGTDWVVADDQTGYFGWAVKTLTLPAAANNLPYFQVRFRTNIGSAAYAYLDKVEITGY